MLHHAHTIPPECNRDFSAITTDLSVFLNGRRYGANGSEPRRVLRAELLSGTFLAVGALTGGVFLLAAWDECLPTPRTLQPSALHPLILFPCDRSGAMRTSGKK